ncbi:MAG: hypothetical protein ACRENZ_00325 [Thermodesulfobacteriota bacterium]
MKILLLVVLIIIFPCIASSVKSGIFTVGGFYACENDLLLLEADRYVEDDDQEALSKMYEINDCIISDPGTQVFLVQGSSLDCTEGDLGDCSYVLFHPIEIRVKGTRKTWWTYRKYLKRTTIQEK